MSKSWGTPTWYFFHTLIEKVKEEHYNDVKGDILGHIKKICSVLPCPDCRDHASQYLSNYNVGQMPTKNHMKMFLFNFHNTVNARLKHRQYQLSDLEVYKRGIFVKIFYYCKQEMMKPRHNKLLADSMMRRQNIENLEKWLIANKGKFYP
tara:strand:+ start:29 stop:478 length:450 start_codon:yes stop_codon:yes gene_type:complete